MSRLPAAALAEAIVEIQLPLGIGLRPGATFDGFVPGPNAEAIAGLRTRETVVRGVYLWGARGTGKTHLLQAVCHQASSRGETAVYLPLARAADFSSGILEDLDALALICIDDIQAVAGQADWERGLFNLYNGARERGHALVITGDCAPRALGLELPDLVTRLGWNQVFRLRPLDDAALGEALRLRAAALGLELTEEVAGWLLRRCERDTNTLFALLERLDRASLSAQRRLTIPFVRELVGMPDA